jgi:hypothetical protein
VTITGTNLTGATVVDFGANAATGVTVVSSTSITATSPAGTAGVANVTVTTPGGTSAISAADDFTYVTPPTGTTPPPTASASSYWEVASDGGIFSFNAPFEGSMGGAHLNAPIVGMA